MTQGTDNKNRKTKTGRWKADDCNLKGSTLAQTKPLAQSQLSGAINSYTPLNAKPTRPPETETDPPALPKTTKTGQHPPAQTTAAATHKTRTKATNQQPGEFGQGRQNQPKKKTGGNNQQPFRRHELTTRTT